MRRLLAVAALALAGDAHAQPAPAPHAGAPLRVHVRGGSELRAVATVSHDELTLHGELIDDAGMSIPGAPVALSAATDKGGTPLRIGPLRACEDGSGRPPPRASGDETVIETDERGGFCAVGKATAPKIMLALKFRGTKLYDAAELFVPVEPAEEHLVRTLLRFEPPPETLDLDRETVTVTASLHVDRSEAARVGPAGSAQRASLPLVLDDERGAHVATEATGGVGSSRVDLQACKLEYSIVSPK